MWLNYLNANESLGQCRALDWIHPATHHANRQSDQQPAHAQPDVEPGVFNALGHAAKVECLEMVRAFT